MTESMVAFARSAPSRVRLLEADPELGARLSGDDFKLARRYAVTEVAQLGRGVHDPSVIGDEAMLGLLVIEGLVIRGVHVAERHCGELVGPGALLRPWDNFGRYAPMPFEVRWRVMEPVKVALLDHRIAAAGARWPMLMQGIVTRAVERAHALALNVAIHCLTHVELKLLVLLWHLADPYGRVTSDGTVVPLKLTHGDLAELIGSQRPSVSLRLAELSEQGKVRRRADRTWLLEGEPPEEVKDMRVSAQAARKQVTRGGAL